MAGARSFSSCMEASVRSWKASNALRTLALAPPSPRQGSTRSSSTELERFIDGHGGADKFEVVLVGHSMGTIVINHLLRASTRLPVSRIVYMAAACTIKDYEDTVFPYLRQHPRAQISQLVLHHTAELRESNLMLFRWLDFAPRGSLLLWIDNFLSSPDTYR